MFVRTQTRWVLASGRAEPALRLFCFPYAGAGPSAFRAWPGALARSIDVAAIHLPGREGRIREPPLRDFPSVVAELVPAMAPLLDVPFAFYGHSVGALVAFGVARELRRRGLPGPRHLFVAARAAPPAPLPEPLLHPLGDRELIAEVGHRYEGIPQAVLEEPELLAMLLPVLRADLAIDETWRHVEEPPLACPITAFGGRDDPEAGEAALAGWAAETSGAFSVEMLPGGHFFLDSARDALLRALCGHLSIRTPA